MERTPLTDQATSTPSSSRVPSSAGAHRRPRRLARLLVLAAGLLGAGTLLEANAAQDPADAPVKTQAVDATVLDEGENWF